MQLKLQEELIVPMCASRPDVSKHTDQLLHHISPVNIKQHTPKT